MGGLAGSNQRADFGGSEIASVNLKLCDMDARRRQQTEKDGDGNFFLNVGVVFTVT